MVKRAIIFILFIICIFLLLTFVRGVEGLVDFIPVLPPIIAIGLAFVTYSVELSLFTGITIGAFISISNGGLFSRLFYSPLKVVDHYIVKSLADSDHISIVIFSLFIGGVVSLIGRSGGMISLVDTISKYAKNSTWAQFMTWLMGIAIFFDDYANTFIVGSSVRPITDKFKISREKLSFIVDATAAPVTSLVIVSTWIGYEIGLIQDVFKSSKIELDPYMSFIYSLPYRFYVIAMLVFIPIIIFLRRDKFQMYEAEKRARTTGNVNSCEGHADLEIDTDNKDNGDLNVFKTSGLNAILPIAVLLVGVVVGLYITGSSSITGEMTVRKILANANSFKSLIWASFSASLVAAALIIFQRIASVEECLKVWLKGVSSMIPAIIILTLAWSLGAVLKDIGTAKAVANLIENGLPLWSLPAIIFIISSTIAFATGTSWGSMAILFPIVVPLTVELTTNSFGEIDIHSLQMAIYPAIGAILSGTVFGDHCSPISDTTIMSSIASGVNHIDHVQTQLPYSILVGGVAVFFGYLPAGFGVNPYLSIFITLIVLFLIVQFTFKKLPE